MILLVILASIGLSFDVVSDDCQCSPFCLCSAKAPAIEARPSIDDEINSEIKWLGQNYMSVEVDGNVIRFTTPVAGPHQYSHLRRLIELIELREGGAAYAQQIGTPQPVHPVVTNPPKPPQAPRPAAVSQTVTYRYVTEKPKKKWFGGFRSQCASGNCP